MKIENCNFNGVVWDKSALETVNTVAKGLLNLTELFKAQSVSFECLLRVGSTDNGHELDKEGGWGSDKEEPC